MIRLPLGTLVIAGFASAAMGAANAAPITFFGVDDAPGFTVPSGGNAETARTSFLNSLTTVGTEDFEGLSLG